jgi:hypothetical protein
MTERTGVSMRWPCSNPGSVDSHWGAKGRGLDAEDSLAPRATLALYSRSLEREVL